MSSRRTTIVCADGPAFANNSSGGSNHRRQMLRKRVNAGLRVRARRRGCPYPACTCQGFGPKSRPDSFVVITVGPPCAPCIKVTVPLTPTVPSNCAVAVSTPSFGSASVAHTQRGLPRAALLWITMERPTTLLLPNSVSFESVKMSYHITQQRFNDSKSTIIGSISACSDPRIN